MQIIRNYIYTIIKGFIIGASMLVPGFSGGTMAMILGIYDKLIAFWLLKIFGEVFGLMLRLAEVQVYLYFFK